MNYLNVSFAEKDYAKSLGARWDALEKRWYAPDGLNLELFEKWLPSGGIIENSVTVYPTSKGITLQEFLRQTSLALKKAVPNEQWIRAEISQYRVFNGGHVSVELVEHNEMGQLAARIQSFIWASNVQRVVGQFVAGTGGPLTTGLKVMVKASIDMTPTNNLRLVITDIDPSYTLGDIEANLKKIRETLTQEGVIENNRKLDCPSDFCRIAVISPKAAAGLGDFKPDASILELHGLCVFDYYSSQFQGPGAAGSLLDCIKQVLVGHADIPYDALCIIRGGGSVTDLYWLNDLALARAICLAKIPVFTGIGHERDNTILDEVSHTRFDTPSKVVGHIRSTIHGNAMNAAKNFQSILLYAHRLVATADKDVEFEYAGIQQGAIKATHIMDNKIDQLFAGIEPAAAQWLYKAQQENEQQFQFIKSRCDADLIKMLTVIDRYFEWMSVGTQQGLSRFEVALDQMHQSLFQSTNIHLVNAIREVENLGREILGLGPNATLNRGFIIARSSEGKPVISAKQAIQLPKLNLEFRDGILKVKPLKP